jgi:hypothetical protein
MVQMPLWSTAMKISLAVFATLILSWSSVLAIDQARLDAFTSALKSACATKNIEAIKELYYTDGASEPLLDQAIHEWEIWLLDYAPKQNLVVSTVEFYPKAEYLSRPGVNKQALADATEPQAMNGQKYGPNLEVIGFVSVKFKQASGGFMGRLNPVGIAPDGSLRIVAKKRM